MRILTWNINGLSTVLHYHPWCEKKTYESLLNALEADVICLQEIKCQRSRLSRAMALVPGYDGYFSFSKTKLGYSGVAIYVKETIQPNWVEEGITGILNGAVHIEGDMDSFLSTQCTTDPAALDAEGRCILMDLGGCVLFNVYFPNETNDGRREFKMDYHACVRWRIDDLLRQGKPVILVGDLNAVHEKIDHCDPEQSMKDNGITDFKDLPQRQWMDKLVAPKGPLVDLCRKYHPDRKGMFTCWNQRLNARPSNYGTRIDYILVSKQLEPYFKYADIRPDILGSDHCPVYADLVDADPGRPSLIQQAAGKSTSPIFAANFDEFSNKQKKISMFFSAASTKTTPVPPVPQEQPQQHTQTSTTEIAFNDANATKSCLVTATALRNQTLPEFPRKPQKALKSYFLSPSSSDGPAAMVIGNQKKKRKMEEETPIDISALMAEAEEKQEAKSAWSALFQPRPVPVCSVHKEPCRLKTVTKKGPNQGRQFYCCSRSVGPQDDPSKEYQCNFFQWKTSSPTPVKK